MTRFGPGTMAVLAVLLLCTSLGLMICGGSPAMVWCSSISTVIAAALAMTGGGRGGERT
ncbi:hypothetical protein [Rhodococcus sp. NBC_00294]|uniref:hypothetical protein n=1 Tax=Rhodococcus sp. NBC_00294 TaxID=2976004 RepID=UPI002E2B696F|nr:hypothetical protein [Rhodococcus sp. NBC_00294]